MQPCMPGEIVGWGKYCYFVARRNRGINCQRIKDENETFSGEQKRKGYSSEKFVINSTYL